jgi:hypothetical protein
VKLVKKVKLGKKVEEGNGNQALQKGADGAKTGLVDGHGCDRVDEWCSDQVARVNYRNKNKK